MSGRKGRGRGENYKPERWGKKSQKEESHEQRKGQAYGGARPKTTTKSPAPRLAQPMEATFSRQVEYQDVRPNQAQESHEQRQGRAYGGARPKTTMKSTTPRVDQPMEASSSYQVEESQYVRPKQPRPHARERHVKKKRKKVHTQSSPPSVSTAADIEEGIQNMNKLVLREEASLPSDQYSDDSCEDEETATASSGGLQSGDSDELKKKKRKRKEKEKKKPHLEEDVCNQGTQDSDEDTNGGSERQKKRKERSSRHSLERAAKRGPAMAAETEGGYVSSEDCSDSSGSGTYHVVNDPSFPRMIFEDWDEYDTFVEEKKKNRKKGRRTKLFEALVQGTKTDWNDPAGEESRDDGEYKTHEKYKGDSSSDEKKKKKKEAETAEHLEDEGLEQYDFGSEDVQECLLQEEPEDDSDHAETAGHLEVQDVELSAEEEMPPDEFGEDSDHAAKHKDESESSSDEKKKKKKKKRKRKEGKTAEHREVQDVEQSAEPAEEEMPPEESGEDSDHASKHESESSSDKKKKKKKKRKRKEGKTAEHREVQDVEPSADPAEEEMPPEESREDSDHASKHESESSSDEKKKKKKKKRKRKEGKTAEHREVPEVRPSAEPAEEEMPLEESGEDSDYASKHGSESSSDKKKKKKKKRKRKEGKTAEHREVQDMEPSAEPVEEEMPPDPCVYIASEETAPSAAALSVEESHPPDEAASQKKKKKKKKKARAQPAEQMETQDTSAEPAAQAEAEADDSHRQRHEESGSSGAASAAEEVPEEVPEEKGVGSDKKKKKKKSKKVRKREQLLRASAMEGAGQPGGSQRDEPDPTKRGTEPPKQAKAKSSVDYIVDFAARQRLLKDENLIFLKHLDAEMDQRAPSLEARYDSVDCDAIKDQIMRQLWLMATTRKVTLLHGEEGCGKTTAALTIAHHASQRLGLHNVLWCDAKYFLHKFKSKPQSGFVIERLLIIDNFLGHTILDPFEKWKTVVDKLVSEAVEGTHVLLVTRSSILDQGMAACGGADFVDIMRKDPRVKLRLKRKALYQKIFPTGTQEPDYKATFSLGFPALCTLASAVPEQMQEEMFNKPRSTLRRFIKNMISSHSTNKAALGLLAVTKDYVDLRKLRCKSVFKKSTYHPILKKLLEKSVDTDKTRKILDCYASLRGLVKIEDDFASFTNEAVREAVLCVLCESHPQFLAKHCSLRLLSRLALITRDPEQRTDDDEKPELPQAAREHFVQRLLDDISDSNYRRTLTSALFEHPSFYRDFQTPGTRGNVVYRRLCVKDKKELYFLFWASGCPTLTEEIQSCSDRVSQDICREGLVGCCYWGNLELFQTLIMKVRDRTSVFSKKLKELVVHPDKVNWERTPFYRDDTLLTLAAQRGNDDVVRKLVALGADVNVPGYRKRTALMHCCARGNRDMVSYLIDCGAMTGLIDVFQNTALHYAVLGCLRPIHEDLFQNGAMQSRNKWGKYPFLLACAAGTRKTILEKLRCGAGEIDLFECLREACRNGRVNVIKFFLKLKKQKGVSFLAGRDEAELADAISDSVLNNRTDVIVHMLLSIWKKRDDRKRLKALCDTFSEHYNTSVLREVWPLIKDSAGKEARVMVRKACRVGNKKGAQYLLNSQAALFDSTVLKAIAYFGDPNFMEWVLGLTRGSVTKEVIIFTLAIKRTEMAKFFLTHYDITDGVGTPVRADAGAGAGAAGAADAGAGSGIGFGVITESWLHHAARFEVVPLIQWLLDNRRVNINLKNSLTHTALFSACQDGKERSVKCLLLYGAKLSWSMKKNIMIIKYGGDRLKRAMEKCESVFEEIDEQRRK